MSMVLGLALSFFFIIRIFHTRKKTSDLDTALVSVEVGFLDHPNWAYHAGQMCYLVMQLELLNRVKKSEYIG